MCGSKMGNTPNTFPFVMILHIHAQFCGYFVILNHVSSAYIKQSIVPYLVRLAFLMDEIILNVILFTTLSLGHTL
jgi:hypothetical protein